MFCKSGVLEVPSTLPRKLLLLLLLLRMGAPSLSPGGSLLSKEEVPLTRDATTSASDAGRWEWG